jgi:hypothetical protein
MGQRKWKKGEWRALAEELYIRQGGKCPHCDKQINWYSFPPPQIAHRVRDTKANRELYGEAALYHLDNLALVDSLECNNALQITRAAHPLEVERRMRQILDGAG